MKKRKGYVLLGLLLFFTVLTLTSTVTVLQQDTKLKRFSEEDLKLNVDALRRGIDLYRYKYTVTSDTPAKISTLNNYLSTGQVDSIANLLSAESIIRARIATDSMKWKIVANLVRNPSFETDNGTDFGEVNGWRGNFSAGDGAPDGWKLTSNGAEQMISIVEPATYVVSFWARSVSPTAEVKLKVWHEAVPCELTAKNQEWKRYYADFSVASPKDVKLEIVRSSPNSGDIVFVDGVMIEKWDPPADVPATAAPSPTAWTHSFNLIPGRADEALQANVFRDLVPQGATPEKLSWWFNW